MNILLHDFAGHPFQAQLSRELARRGHRVRPRPPGDDVFGAVVAAGTAPAGPFAAADRRRHVRSGAA